MTRHSYRPAFLAVLFALALPVFAETADVPWRSGGIGEEERQAMQQAAGEYNVRALFADREGHFMAAIPFRVLRGKNEILSGISEGPMLFLRLPPGSYSLEAEVGGRTQKKSFVVGKGRVAPLSFVSTGP